MVKMIKTIGAITVTSPRNFIGTARLLPPRRGRSPADSRSMGSALSRFGFRAGLVTLRQTFVRRCHGGTCPRRVVKDEQ